MAVESNLTRESKRDYEVATPTVARGLMDLTLMSRKSVNDRRHKGDIDDIDKYAQMSGNGDCLMSDSRIIL